MIPKRLDNNPSVRLKVANNMRKLVSRGYITEGFIIALTSFFSVPMGTDDIRMVFDATVSRLKNSLWAPNFMLPSMGSLLMMVGLETHMVDLDVGGVFITLDFHWCWPSISEWIWYTIWGIRSNIKEHLFECAG